jgi:hypothetical protein
MKFTVAQLYDAVNALINIANRPRVIPSMASYKLARMHDTLEPHFARYEQQRIALVQKHGSEQFADPEKTKSLGWGVQPGTDAFKAYADEWGAITKQELEIEVKPITTTMLGNDPKGLEMTDYKQLGGLVIDNIPEESGVA